MKRKKFAALMAAIVCALMLVPSMALAKTVKVDVVVIHPNLKCEKCAAIKKNTQEVVDTKFAKQLKEGKIEYKEVTYGPGQNEDLKAKYNVTMTTVVLVSYDENGKETIKNLGRFPLNNAPSNPEKYRKELTQYIYYSLK